ncbi:MAG: hypothetical protein AAGU74_08930 [Bacillota bacterium]
MDKREFTRQLLQEISMRQGGGSSPGAVFPAAPRAAQPVGKTSLSGSSGSAGDAPRLLVVADLPAQEALPALRELYALNRFGCRVDLIARAEALGQANKFASAGNRYGADAPFCPEALTSVRAVIVLPSQDLLARAALGLQDTPAAAAVLLALWRGIDVYMDFERALGVGGQTSRSAALAALYGAYADKLRAMGVKPLSGQYLAAMLDAGIHAPQASTAPDAASGCPQERAKRAVITRKDVLAYGGPREWMLPPNAVVTALAKEAAQKRDLVLTRANTPGFAGKDE